MRPNGDPAENRTPVSSLRGSRPNRQTTGPYFDNLFSFYDFSLHLQSKFKHLKVLLYPIFRMVWITSREHYSYSSTAPLQPCLQPKFTVFGVVLYPFRLGLQVEKKKWLIPTLSTYIISEPYCLMQVGLHQPRTADVDRVLYICPLVAT